MFLVHFLFKHDHFTKTGSGKTQGKLKHDLVRFLQASSKQVRKRAFCTAILY